MHEPEFVRLICEMSKNISDLQDLLIQYIHDFSKLEDLYEEKERDVAKKKKTYDDF